MIYSIISINASLITVVTALITALISPIIVEFIKVKVINKKKFYLIIVRLPKNSLILSTLGVLNFNFQL